MASIPTCVFEKILDLLSGGIKGRWVSTPVGRELEAFVLGSGIKAKGSKEQAV